jgi:hypothetical protein
MRCTRVPRMLTMGVVDFEGFFSMIPCLGIFYLINVACAVLIYIGYNLFSQAMCIVLLPARNSHSSFF